ncbi:MAG: serine hydrolase [Flavobacteriaceae bacterium]|nr:serine hydrolase [Flavobacteriaceae bacterium]
MRFFLSIVLVPIGIFSQVVDPLLVVGEAHQEKQKFWVDSIYRGLTLEEKVGQLFVPMVFSENQQEFDSTIKLIQENHIGGIIFSRGGPLNQTQWLNEFQAQSKVPLLITMDAEWGIGMRLDSVIDFPWAMTLGAIQDLELIEKIAYQMGKHAKRLGIHMNHGPVLDVNTNPNNPIIGNRSFGESKKRVTETALAYMKGHHKAGVLTTGKHFPGHGDTDADSHLTLPTISHTKKHIENIEIYPYKKLIEQGLPSVMVAHLNVPSLTDSVVPTSLSKKVITNLLKSELNFKGLILTDALNMKGATMYAPAKGMDKMAFQAGNDVLLISNDIPWGIQSIVDAVKSGEITQQRLAYSVKKILKAKYKVGLHHYKAIDPKNLIQEINPPIDQTLYEKAIKNAMTLVHNKKNLVPFEEFTSIGYFKIGDGDGTIFKQQLSNYATLEELNGQQLESMDSENASVDTVVIAYHKKNHTPYVDYRFSENELNQIWKLSQKFQVVLVSFTSPYALGQLNAPNELESILVAYQNSAEAQKIAADALMGYSSILGKLPVSPSKEIKIGLGIELQATKSMPYADPLDLGFHPQKLNRLDQFAEMIIDSMVTPGLQLLVARKGKVVYNKSFGTHTYAQEIRVENHHLFDLASLTKILATVPLVMQEVSHGKLRLEDQLKNLNPRAVHTNKSDLSVKQILSHHTGLQSWIPFYLKTLDSIHKKPLTSLYSPYYKEDYPIMVYDGLFLHTDYTQEILQEVYTSDLISKPMYRYSDLGFILLMDYFEDTYVQSFDDLVWQRIIQPLGLMQMSYNPHLYFPDDQIIPSELDDYFRYGIVDGYVHDMTAALMGGVGAHAGLFANAKDVAVIMNLFLNKGKILNQQYFDAATFDLFNTRHYKDHQNDRALGFDKKRKINQKRFNTAGDASDLSFGHYGFTGTFAWADPQYDLIFVFLSNRTFPTMNNTLISKNYVRPRMHQLVYDALIEKK